MLQNFVKLLGGDPNKRTIEKLADVVGEGINAHEPEFTKLRLFARLLHRFP